MANICESLIKIVSSERQKVLTCLDQNGMRPGLGSALFPNADVAPSVERWSLSHLQGIYAERGKPDCLRNCGNRTARGGDRQAGMGSRRKRMPCRNRADRGSEFAPPERVQTSEWSLITRQSENIV
jgi:hypothetical protein